MKSGIKSALETSLLAAVAVPANRHQALQRLLLPRLRQRPGDPARPAPSPPPSRRILQGNRPPKPVRSRAPKPGPKSPLERTVRGAPGTSRRPRGKQPATRNLPSGPSRPKARRRLTGKPRGAVIEAAKRPPARPVHLRVALHRGLAPADHPRMQSKRPVSTRSWMKSSPSSTRC
jgi:hypothetical protein